MQVLTRVHTTNTNYDSLDESYLHQIIKVHLHDFLSWGKKM